MKLKEGFTLDELQAYIKRFDYTPENRSHYFYKLIEEVGELSDAMRKGLRMTNTGTIKGTVEEELYDVLYYVAAIANLYDIRLEECALKKEEINIAKFANKRTSLS
jgi:NTP pyrophosphatase (non-canonical NTP hydrolase)